MVMYYDEDIALKTLRYLEEHSILYQISRLLSKIVQFQNTYRRICTRQKKYRQPSTGNLFPKNFRDGKMNERGLYRSHIFTPHNVRLCLHRLWLLQFCKRLNAFGSKAVGRAFDP